MQGATRSSPAGVVLRAQRGAPPPGPAALRGVDGVRRLATAVRPRPRGRRGLSTMHPNAREKPIRGNGKVNGWPQNRRAFRSGEYCSKVTFFCIFFLISSLKVPFFLAERGLRNRLLVSVLCMYASKFAPVKGAKNPL